MGTLNCELGFACHAFVESRASTADELILFCAQCGSVERTPKVATSPQEPLMDVRV